MKIVNVIKFCLLTALCLVIGDLLLLMIEDFGIISNALEILYVGFILELIFSIGASILLYLIYKLVTTKVNLIVNLILIVGIKILIIYYWDNTILGRSLFNFFGYLIFNTLVFGGGIFIFFKDKRKDRVE